MTEIKRYVPANGDRGEGTVVRNDQSGTVVFYEDHATIVAVLQEQVRALAAEGYQMLQLLTDISEQYQECQSESEENIAIIDLDYISEVNSYVSRDVGGENPFEATDAVLREICANAVDDSDDKKRMDWLCSHVVEVRQPLFYGSNAMFYAQCDSDDCEEYHSMLREQVDAAFRAGEQP